MGFKPIAIAQLFPCPKLYTLYDNRSMLVGKPILMTSGLSDDSDGIYTHLYCEKNFPHAAKYTCDMTNDSNLRENNSKIAMGLKPIAITPKTFPMPQNFHAIWVHLIWSTKYREPLITKNIKWPLYKKMKEICKSNDYFLDHINGAEDHVHLLMELKPKFAISDVIKNIKGLSWEWMRSQEISTRYFSWQDGFAAISVSPSQVNRVRQYIRNQEIHHKKISFEDEMRRYKVSNEQ